MEKQSKSLLGLWRNFMDNLEIAGSKFGDIIVKEFDLKNVIANMTAMTRNSDAFFKSNAENIQNIVDTTKSAIGYIREFGIHTGAAFRVLYDIGNNLFPNTFSYLSKLSKGGKDLNTSWREAKGNMIGIFEDMAKGIARMLDSIRNMFRQLIADINRMNIKYNPFNEDELGKVTEQDVYKVAPDLEKYKSKYEYAKFHEGVLKGSNAPDFMGLGRNHHYYKDIDQNLGDKEFRKAIIKYHTSEKDKLWDELTKADYVNRYNTIQSDLMIHKGVYTPSVTNYEKDVTNFFSKIRADELARAKDQDFKERLEASRAIMNSHPDFDKVTGRKIQAMSMVGGGMMGTATHGLMNDIYANPQNYKPYVNPTMNPDTREIRPAVQLLTHAMQDLVTELKKFKNPSEELKDTLHNLEVPFKAGVLTNEQYARGVYDAYMKAADKMGGTEIKFASGIYKGSAEALNIEARARMGLDQPAKFEDQMQRIMEQSVELEKQQRDYLKEISRTLETQRNQNAIDFLGNLMKLGPGG
jgi:hypothetical protein